MEAIAGDKIRMVMRSNSKEFDDISLTLENNTAEDDKSIQNIEVEQDLVDSDKEEDEGKTLKSLLTYDFQQLTIHD